MKTVNKWFFMMAVVLTAACCVTSCSKSDDPGGDPDPVLSKKVKSIKLNGLEIVITYDSQGRVSSYSAAPNGTVTVTYPSGKMVVNRSQQQGESGEYTFALSGNKITSLSGTTSVEGKTFQYAATFDYTSDGYLSKAQYTKPYPEMYTYTWSGGNLLSISINGRNDSFQYGSQKNNLNIDLLPFIATAGGEVHDIVQMFGYAGKQSTHLPSKVIWGIRNSFTSDITYTTNSEGHITKFTRSGGESFNAEITYY